jgi:hypothetical protein
MSEERKFSLSAEERETIITFDDSSNECEIYTCSRPMMTKLDRLCKDNPKNYKLVKKDAYSKTYHTSKRFISFRSGAVKRELTEEQKAKAAERLKKARTEIK